MASSYLRNRHSLVGKSLIPVILGLKSTEDPPTNLARLRKEHPLENYSLDELDSEFSKLTGEGMDEVLSIGGRTKDIENARFCVHLAIIQANAVGAPKGTFLESARSAPETPRQEATCSGTPLSDAAPRSSSTTPATAVSRESTKRKGTNDLGESHQDVEGRLRKMEEHLQGLSKQTVDEALKNVRTLASRPKLTSSSVLIAALEVLVDNAVRTGHAESEFYGKALSACRQFEDNPDVCNLCMKLIGSNEDRKISATIAEWVKNSTISNSKVHVDKAEVKLDNGKDPLFPTPFGTPFYPYYPFLGPPPHIPQPGGHLPPGGPVMPHMVYPHFNPYPNVGNLEGQGRHGGRQRPRQRGPCYFCKEQGHLVNNCPKLKKE